MLRPLAVCRVGVECLNQSSVSDRLLTVRPCMSLRWEGRIGTDLHSRLVYPFPVQKIIQCTLHAVVYISVFLSIWTVRRNGTLTHGHCDSIFVFFTPDAKPESSGRETIPTPTGRIHRSNPSKISRYSSEGETPVLCPSL